MVAVVAFVAPSAAWGSAPSGAAVVTDPNGDPITSGGSATQFGLILPNNAACPGDTEHHGWFVSSFAIPVVDDPSQLTFKLNYPDEGVDLITVDGVPWITQATTPFTGAIPTPPLFSWSRYDHDTVDLPMGRWTVGIACVKGKNPLSRYWSTEVEFVASPRDPGGFTWNVIDPPKPVSHGPSDLVVAVVVVAAALAAGSVVWFRRRLLKSSPARSR